MLEHNGGCEADRTLVLRLKGERIVSKLRSSSVFVSQSLARNLGRPSIYASVLK